MFEQTLLTHPASARKTGALAASLMAQSAILGVLVVGPLLYTQALPMVPVFLGVLTAPPLPAPPPPVPIARTSALSNAGARSMRIFIAPTRVPTGSPRMSEPTIISDPSVENVFIPGPGIEGATNSIPTALLAAPIVEVAKVTPPPVAEAKPVKVSSGVLAAKILKRVVPAYPVIAKVSHVSGTVRLLATLSKDGRIENLRVIDGPPLLRNAALEAVRQWIYSPTILNGVPVEVEAPIEVNFTLN